MKLTLNTVLASKLSSYPTFVNKVLNDFQATFVRIYGTSIEAYTGDLLTAVKDVREDLIIRMVKAMPNTGPFLIVELVKSIKRDRTAPVKSTPVVSAPVSAPATVVTETVVVAPVEAPISVTEAPALVESAPVIVVATAVEIPAMATVTAETTIPTAVQATAIEIGATKEISTTDQIGASIEPYTATTTTSELETKPHSGKVVETGSTITSSTSKSTPPNSRVRSRASSIQNTENLTITEVKEVIRNLTHQQEPDNFNPAKRKVSMTSKVMRYFSDLTDTVELVWNEGESVVALPHPRF